MIDPELLEVLACPETRQRLHAAPREVLERVNGRIARGALANRAGTLARQPLTEGLVREDGKVLYPVLDGIPLLLIDEGLALDDGS